VITLDRDSSDREALFLQVAHTDEIHDLIEALGNMTSSPPGLAKVIANRNGALLDLTGLLAFLGGPVTYKPFAVMTRPHPTLPNTWQYFVMPGNLKLTLTPSNTATVTDISVAGSPPILKTWNGSIDVVYLYCTGIDFIGSPTNPLASATFAIKSLSDSGTFDRTADAWSSPDAYLSGTASMLIARQTDQTAFCLELGTIAVDPVTGAPVVTQQTTTNLVISNEPVDGSAAVFPAPSP
jgi:hypothetical protein